MGVAIAFHLFIVCFLNDHHDKLIHLIQTSEYTMLLKLMADSLLNLLYVAFSSRFSLGFVVGWRKNDQVKESFEILE